MMATVPKLVEHCRNIDEVRRWRQAYLQQFGWQQWIIIAAHQAEEKFSTAGDLYQEYLIEDGATPDEAKFVASFFAMVDEDYIEDELRMIEAKAVDAAQSEQTDWRG